MLTLKMTGGTLEVRYDKRFLYSTNGPMDQWSNGPMVQWTNGPMDHWSNQSMIQWSNGPMDHTLMQSPDWMGLGWDIL